MRAVFIMAHNEFEVLHIERFGYAIRMLKEYLYR